MTDLKSIEACAAQKTVIVVLGDGGPAGPAMVRLLAFLGCDVPASSDAISRFNDAVLQSVGTIADQWTGFNRQWLASPKASEFLDRALEVLRSEFGGSYLAVIEDARMATLLPFWNVVFERAGLLPRYLFAMDDPADLAETLGTDRGIEPRGVHLAWLHTAIEAEYGTRGKLRSFVNSRAVRSDPVGTMDDLASRLQLVLPRNVEVALIARQDELDEIGQSLRSPVADGRLPAPMADWVRATWIIFEEWAAKGESAEAHYVLDAMREALDDAAPVFVGVGEGLSARVRTLEQELAAANAEVRRSEAAALLAEQAGERERSDLRGRISHLESALAQRMAQVDESDRMLNIAQRQADDQRRTIEESMRSLKDVQEQLRGRYAEIVTLTRMLASEDAAARKAERNAERAAAIARVFETGGGGKGVFLRRFGGFLPWRWHLRRIKRRLEREGLFDAAAYLAVNVDVAQAGIDPLEHYLRHGMNEGRPLGIA
ncbi:MAG: hypothetical protein QM688_01945 [Sphingomonas bacterium]